MNIGSIIITATGTAIEATGDTGMASMNSSELVQMWQAFGPELRTGDSLLAHNTWPRFGAMRTEAKAPGQFMLAC